MAYECRNMWQEIKHIYVIHSVLAVYIGLDTLPGTSSGICLRSFTILRKEITSFAMSVRPSVRMDQLIIYWTDFHDI